MLNSFGIRSPEDGVSKASKVSYSFDAAGKGTLSPRIPPSKLMQSAGTQVLLVEDAQRSRELRKTSNVSAQPKQMTRSMSVSHLLVKLRESKQNGDSSTDHAGGTGNPVGSLMLHSKSAQRLVDNPLLPPRQSSLYHQTLERAREVLDIGPKSERGFKNQDREADSTFATKLREVPDSKLLETLVEGSQALQYSSMADSKVSSLQIDQRKAAMLQAKSYLVLAEENAELARALQARTTALENILQKMGMHLDRRVHIEEEVKRLGKLLESHDANARVTGAELVRVTETLSELKVERGELIAQSSAAVAASQNFKDRFERQQQHLDMLRSELNSSFERNREESRKAAKLESELVAMSKELVLVQSRLNSCKKERDELAHQRGKLETLALEAQAKELSARSEHRTMSENLMERRLYLLDVEAKVKQLKENEGRTAESLLRAQEDLKMQAQRSQQLHERAAAATVKAEELEQKEAELEEQLKSALERLKASETRATALEEQLGKEVERSSSFYQELEETNTKLRAEAEARRAAQLARVKALREQEKSKKSQTRLGTEYENLSRRFEQLQESSSTLEAALAEEKQQNVELETRLKELNPTKDAYHQTLSELQRLTIRYQELQSVSNTQIMGLTDLRDRQAQQIELLRTKLHTTTEKLKVQSEDSENIRRERDKLVSKQTSLVQERDLLQRKVISLTDSFGKTIAELRTQIAGLESQLKEQQGLSIDRLKEESITLDSE